MNKASVYDCSIIELNSHFHKKGSITVVENNKEIPFDSKRIFYLYDIKGGRSRGAHVHKECHQFLVAVSGSFDVILDDGKVKRTVTLNQPYKGLHIQPGVWASEVNFSSGAICLVLASHIYDESDYIRDYKEFLKYRNETF